jgi:MFS transporter, ACS family, hexuronate transporter
MSTANARAQGFTIAHLRWYICGLLFFATTLNYVDRQVLGILKPVLDKELGVSESQYGWVVFAFQLAYALMMPIAGRVLDRIGTRLGYALAVTVWSLASMGHALATSALGFAAARFSLGIGEAANFPAAIKTIADWFPKRERALATGIFNSGSNVGAIIAPLMVPFMASHFGWRTAFLPNPVVGLLWVVFWLMFFRHPSEHRNLGAGELALIRSDQGEAEAAEKIGYLSLLTRRGSMAFFIGKFLTDPVWWFYLYWLPGFLNKTYGLDLTQLGPPLITIYIAADVGSVGGGWLSSWMMRRGWSVNRARKTAMLICAIAVTAVMFVQNAGGNLWLAVALISIATAAHQGWSANLYTLTSDLFPMRAVGSVVGFGGMGGAIGGMLVAPAVGYWLAWSHASYGPLFVVAGSVYLIALGIIHVLAPSLDKKEAA